MLNVVLVTPVYAECGRNAGVFTRALASLLVDLGHRVRVISSHAESPMPGHEEFGRLTIHRLAIKRRNLNASFVASSIEYVHELVCSKHCDVIIDVDADLFSIALHTLNPMRIPAHSIHTSSITSSTQLPLVHGVWEPPKIQGRTLLALETTDQERSIVIEGYRDSNARAAGWSLMALEHDGTWAMIDEAKSSSMHDHDAILIPVQRSGSIVSYLAQSQGMMSANSDGLSLEPARVRDEINSIIARPQEDRRKLSFANWESTQSETERAARHAFWTQLLYSHQKSRRDTLLKIWRNFEGSSHQTIAAGRDS